MEEKILIEKVRCKDNEAYADLLAIYERMIRSLVNEHNLLYGDYKVSKDDLYQEGCIGLLDACKSYKFGSAAKFSTYAYVVIKRRINHAFKNMILPYTSETYSFDKLLKLDRLQDIATNRVEDNPIAYCAQKEKNDQIDNHLKRMNNIDREIIKLRARGFTYAQIADKLMVSAKHVDNRIYRLRKKYLETCWYEDQEKIIHK